MSENGTRHRLVIPFQESIYIYIVPFSVMLLHPFRVVVLSQVIFLLMLVSGFKIQGLSSYYVKKLSSSSSSTFRVSMVARRQMGLQMVASRPVSSSTGIKEISSQIKDMRSRIAADDKASMMIDALRGKNLNDDDKQGDGVDMQVVRMSSSKDEFDVLPTVYDPTKLERYFGNRPISVITRVWQIVSTSSSFMLTVFNDWLNGRLEEVEVARAAELRKTIVSLGPFFIKLGQALSIRPDILSPRAMVELQQLCDKVPCFDNRLAMETIETELGRPPSEIFSKMSPDPVAAASLGQVYRATLKETNEEVAVKVQRYK